MDYLITDNESEIYWAEHEDTATVGIGFRLHEGDSYSYVVDFHLSAPELVQDFNLPKNWICA